MNADGKIYILITDKLPGGDTPGPAPEPTEPETEKKSDKELFEHWAKTRLLNEAKSLAMKSVMYTMNNIGNFTGNYVLQAKMNETVAIVQGLSGIAMTTIAGAKYGPVGAAIGLGIGVLNTSASAVLRDISASVQNKKTNYEIEQLRVRAGLNSLIDGSRGTEN